MYNYYNCNNYFVLHVFGGTVHTLIDMTRIRMLE